MSPGRALLTAVAVGCGLGGIYGILRPLRRRHTALPDLAFVAAMGAGWVWLHFGFLHGDIRFVTTAAMGAGALGWELTAGKLLTPVFDWIWDRICGFLGCLCRPGRIIFENLWIFVKKVFAYFKKRGTMVATKDTHGEKHREARIWTKRK